MPCSYTLLPLFNTVISDNTMNKVQPLSTSAKVILSDEHSTQDSIINDSGFLPSTPPSKKVHYNITTVTLSKTLFEICCIWLTVQERFSSV